MIKLNFRQQTILKTDHETQQTLTSDKKYCLLSLDKVNVVITPLPSDNNRTKSSDSDKHNLESEIQTDNYPKYVQNFLRLFVDQVDRLNNTIFIYDNNVYSDMIQSSASCFHKVQTRIVEVYI